MHREGKKGWKWSWTMSSVFILIDSLTPFLYFCLIMEINFDFESCLCVVCMLNFQLVS